MITDTANKNKPKVTPGPNNRNSSIKSFLDLTNECISHMAERGFNFDGNFDTSGKTIKFAGRPDRPREKIEWYKADQKINNDGNISLQVTYNSQHASLKSDKHYVFKSKTYEPQSESEIKAQNERVAKLKQEREEKDAAEDKKRKEQAIKDRERFKNASESGHSPYQERKHVGAHGTRVEGEITLVPMRDEKGVIQALQEIHPEKKIFQKETKPRDKHFTNSTKGLYHTLGEIKDGNLIRVSEGYATASSVYESTGCTIPHVVAFSAGAYQNVIPTLKRLYPKSPITICADNNVHDDPKEKNTGLEEAKKVAEQFGCSVVYPVFPADSNKNSDGKHYADFNDLEVIMGKEEVIRQLNPTATATSPMQDELKKLNLLEKEDPCSSFSLDHFPKDLREYITLLSEATDAHPIMIASSVIATVAAFVQKRMYIPKGTYFQKLHPNMWLLNIMESGGFKSTAQEYGSFLAREKSNEILDQMLKFGKQDEEKKIEVSTGNPILSNKYTSEAFLQVLSQGHSGVMITSEFGGWLQNMEKSHNSDLKAILTDLYDVPPSFRSTTKTQGDFILKDPCFSINGVSTLDWIKDNLKPNDVSSGFFARFLIYTPPSQPNDYIPNALPVKRENTPLLHEAQNKIRETLNNMDVLYEYQLSENAEIAFNAAHVQLHKTMWKHSEKCQKILKPYLKRWSPYILKLAMIMRLFEDPLSKELSETSINAAMAMLLPAIKSTALLFQGELGESDHQRKCRVVYEWICSQYQKGRLPTWGKLISSHTLDGGSTMYEYPIKTLLESGKIRENQKYKKQDWLYIPIDQQLEEFEKA